MLILFNLLAISLPTHLLLLHNLRPLLHYLLRIYPIILTVRSRQNLIDEAAYLGMLLVALADARRRRRCHHGLDLHAILFAHLVNCFRNALIVGFGRVNCLHHVQLLGAHHLAISVIVLLLQASPCPRPLLLLYHLHVPRLQFHSLHTFLIFLFFAGFGRMRIRVSLCDRLLFAIGVHLLHLDVGLEWCL